MKVFRLAIFGVMLIPGWLQAQKREDILSIQRDVAQLQDQLKQMQASQDQKLDGVSKLLQQALDESNRLGTAMSTMQRTVTDRLNDQSSKVEAPIAVLGTKVDQSSEELRSLRENVANLATRFANLDSKLADISSAIRSLSNPAPPPPANGAAQTPPPPAPAGVSAESLFQNAFRDYSSGKDELAMMEFNNYLKYFPQSDNAASAQYYVAQIYDRAKQYDDAVQAFDAVLERYPDNPKTPDAQYGKAYDLMKGGHKADSAAEFKEFLARYPTHSLARNAQEHLKALGPVAAVPRRTRKQQ